VSKSACVLFCLSLAAPLASAQTVFKCVEKDGTALYRNSPCPSESQSKVWLRTDPQNSNLPPARASGGSPAVPDEPRAEAPAPPAAASFVAPRDEPRAETPPASGATVSQGEPRVGMTTSEVRAVLGAPTEVTQEEVVDGRVQTWSYGSRSLQFDPSGRLSAMPH
jgi:uncharacterized protein DUF4124